MTDHIGEGQAFAGRMPGKGYDGQDPRFSGYGGIEDPVVFAAAKYGQGWQESVRCFLEEIEGFTQALLEPDANNCTLASITRVMKYYGDIGYSKIPGDIFDIYAVVRDIGIKHDYDPVKTGLLRDLFIYTPWEIDNMVDDVWHAFGYRKGDGRNCYTRRIRLIKAAMENRNPVLLNIVSGDYPGHTVTVTGYLELTRDIGESATFVRIFDGWSETARYIDWREFGETLANITKFIPPPLQ